MFSFRYLAEVLEPDLLDSEMLLYWYCHLICYRNPGLSGKLSVRIFRTWREIYYLGPKHAWCRCAASKKPWKCYIVRPSWKWRRSNRKPYLTRATDNPRITNQNDHCQGFVCENASWACNGEKRICLGKITGQGHQQYERALPKHSTASVRYSILCSSISKSSVSLLRIGEKRCSPSNCCVEEVYLIYKTSWKERNQAVETTCFLLMSGKWKQPTKNLTYLHHKTSVRMIKFGNPV